MDEETPCIICTATDFRYDDEQCRNICNVCNAMQEITGIGITTLENDKTVRFNRLQTVKLKSNKKVSKAQRKQEELQDATPWNLEQIFRWLFEKQIESMRPHVVDWAEFEWLCWALWARYTTVTGVDFDMVTARHEEVRLRKYPVGWGVRYDPRRGENPLKKATRKLRRLQKEARLDHDDEADDVDCGDPGDSRGGHGDSEERAEKNYKKVRIERMVHMKRVDKEEREQERLAAEKAALGVLDDGVDDVVTGKQEREQPVVKKEEERRRKQEKCGSDGNTDNESDVDGVLCDHHSNKSDSDDVVESELSDEQDPSYLQLDYMDERDKTTVRILRKKKAHEVMFNGSFYANASRLMETNVALLFLGLYLSREKRPHCCCLMDVLRLIARRQIPYIGIRRFVPAHRFAIADASYHYCLLRDRAPAWQYLLTSFHKLMPALRLNFLVKSDLDGLIHRMIADLNLPAGLGQLTDHMRTVTKATTDRLIGAKSGSNSNLIRTNLGKLQQLYPITLAPEPLCLAHVFLALRCLVRLDGCYETRVSELARAIMATATDTGDSASQSGGPSRLFLWSDWWRSQWRAAGLASARTWRDLERDGAAGSLAFLGEPLDSGCAITDDYSRYTELGLHWQPGLNNRGRLARPDQAHTHQSVIDQIQRPLRAVFSAFAPRIDRPPPPQSGSERPADFTGTDIRYLVEPRAFWAEHRSSDGGGHGDGDDERIEELTRLVEQHGLAMTRITFEEAAPDENVFHRDFNWNLTEIESDLLEILTHGTGFSAKDVWPYIGTLERSFFDNPRKTRIRRKLRAKRVL